MTSALKKAAGNILSSAELYRKLTRPQRICLWIVLGVVTLSLLVLFLHGGTEAGVPKTGEAAASTAAAPGGADGSGADWPFRSSFLQSPGQLEAHLCEVNRRRIEQTILWNPKIETATVVHSPARSPRRALDPGSRGTAAVAVKLKPGVPRLERSEAEAIRSMVSRALNIEPRDVSLTDSDHNSYAFGGSQPPPADVGEAEDRWRRVIEEKVGGYCSTFFKPGEFHVAVIVYLSPEQIRVEKEDVDPAKSISKPTKSEWQREEIRGDEELAGGMTSPPVSRRTVIRETTEEQPRFSWEKTSKQIPAGGFKGVGVIVCLDLGAVKGVLSRDPRFAEGLGSLDESGGSPDSLLAGELDKYLSEYVIEQEEALASLLHPLDGVSVRVMVRPFSDSQLAGGTAPLPAPVAAAQMAAAPGNPWSSALPVVVVILSTLGLASGVCWLARRRPAPRASGGAGGSPAGIPHEGAPEWALRDGMREALADFHQRMGRVSSRDEPQETLLRAVNETASRVRRRPDLAASVLRIWLAQDAGAPRERTVRS